MLARQITCVGVKTRERTCAYSTQIISTRLIKPLNSRLHRCWHSDYMIAALCVGVTECLNVPRAAGG